MNIINTYIIITTLVFILFYKKGWDFYFEIFLILTLSLVNEFISIHYKSLYKITSSLYIISNFILWLRILLKALKVPLKTAQFILWLFALFSLVNFLWVEQFSFNKMTFLLGSFAYLLLFIYFSYMKLKDEEITFFSNPEFLLISAPILFFLGLSFLFGFRSYELTRTYIFEEITLYTLVAYSVNIVYYSLINLYIFQKRKESHA